LLRSDETREARNFGGVSEAGVSTLFSSGGGERFGRNSPPGRVLCEAGKGSRERVPPGSQKNRTSFLSFPKKQQKAGALKESPFQ